ncbi:MAG: hypothetical protein IJN67_11715 [Oscillospiraceae bacterium]|nr:hypothetical protein [Oscillospiraceae bacterium]
MVGKNIKGITIEFNGSTVKLNKALKEVEGYGKDLEKQLKDVDKALELDPKNTELLSQKQRILSEQIENTKEKLDLLRQAEEKAAKSVGNYDDWKAAFDPIKDQIDQTKKRLTELSAEQKKLERAGKADTQAYQDIAKEADGLKDKLKDLHKQADAVTEQFGEPIPTREYEQLQTEIAVTASKLKALEQSSEKNLQEIANATDPTRKAIHKIGDAIEDVEKKSAGFGDILKADLIAESAGRIVDSIKDITEETKSYRKMMGSLEVSSEANGYTADQRAEAYKRLYGVLGDDQSAVTALANLQALGLEQEPLMELIDHIIGGWARYGDSIPIDSLAEAVNETVKTGHVTGTFADILNWAAQEGETYGTQLQDITKLAEQYEIVTAKGETIQEKYTYWLQKKTAAGEQCFTTTADLANIEREYTNAAASGEATLEGYIEKLKKQVDAGNACNNAFTGCASAEDYFNLALERCSTEAERADLVMKTLSDQGLSQMAEKWRENNASMVESNEVSADLQEQLADLGETVEPLATMFTEMLTEALSWFNGLDVGTQKFLLSTVGTVSGLGVLGNSVDGVSDIIEKLSKVNLPGLERAFGKISGMSLPGLKSAFSSAFGFIVANPIPALIAAAAGLVLWIGKDGDEIQAKLGEVDGYLQNVFAQDWTEVFGPVLGGILNGFLSYLENWWNSAFEVFNGGIDFIRGVFTGDWERAWEGVKGVFSGILDGMLALVGLNLDDVQDAFKTGIEKVKGFFSGWEWKWPKLKMPHFSVSGSFDFSSFPPSVPKIAVDWYAKGGILNGAQIFGMLGNRLLGGGEAGREAVLPLDSFYAHLEGMLGNVLGSSYAHIGTMLTHVLSGTGQSTVLSVDGLGSLKDTLAQLVGKYGSDRPVTVQVHIEHFENNTDRDLDDLADDLAERIEFRKQQVEAGLA